jgi:glyoxylase-like metal-dependent hydrolase (beta-lactamase superfamily II)
MPSQLSRRRFLATTATAATACLIPRTLLAQSTSDAQWPPMVLAARTAAATGKVTTHPLRGNISVIMGSGGNIAVLPGPQGKLLVDAGISTSRPQITEALLAISPDPIQHLINTHWHYDHTDGNDWVHAAGATIIAQQKTQVRLSSPQTIEAFHATFPARDPGAIPTLTFDADHSLETNGNHILLKHYDPAHTDTDISVHFADADILHAGDTFFNGSYPFIDYSTGGHIDGMIRATKRNLAEGTADTIVIPGHGPIGNKAQLSAYYDMLVATRDSVARLKQQGKTVDEVIAAKPTAAYDDKWGKGFVNPPTYLHLVYQGV